MGLKINNRRYIGSKTKLLEKIEMEITKVYKKKGVFADVFGGTGVVSEHFSNLGYDIIINDFLYSNYIAYKTWLSNEPYSLDKIIKIIDFYNELNPDEIKENYFSKTYGDKYFTVAAAKKIGFIREDIEKRKSDLTIREYYALITSLMYATDKIANTVGHFEHFLSSKPTEMEVKLQIPELNKKEKVSYQLFCEDANKLVRKIKADIVYIDPPYNARQYVNFYHVLENLARWEKPEIFEGISMKFKRDNLKSDYSKSKAPIVFKDLIDNIDAKVIVVSYNNTYSAKSNASNNKISEKEIFDILSAKGKVSVKKIKYKHFTAGKTDFKNHKEILYICKVGE